MFNKMISSIKAIVDAPAPPASEGEIATFEKQFCIKLPEDYKTFLRHSNGGAINELDIIFALDNSRSARHGNADHLVYYFLPLLETSYCGYGSVEDCIRILKDAFLVDWGLSYDYTKDLIPFAITATSMKLVIGCTERYYGKVFLLDINDHPGHIDHLFLPVADSFEAFILEKLIPCNEKSVQLLQQRIVSHL